MYTHQHVVRPGRSIYIQVETSNYFAHPPISFKCCLLVCKGGIFQEIDPKSLAHIELDVCCYGSQSLCQENNPSSSERSYQNCSKHPVYSGLVSWTQLCSLSKRTRNKHKNGKRDMWESKIPEQKEAKRTDGSNNSFDLYCTVIE